MLKNKGLLSNIDLKLDEVLLELVHVALGKLIRVGISIPVPVDKFVNKSKNPVVEVGKNGEGGGHREYVVEAFR